MSNNELAEAVQLYLDDRGYEYDMDHPDTSRRMGIDIAAVANAVGYRKPRTITTADELDALPVGSVVLDPIGLSLHKNAFTGWCASNGAKEIPLDMLQCEALPATVLHEPEATA